MSGIVAVAKPSSMSVIAPAGCGKTHLIVERLALRTDTRSLVLTHTNAGVGVVLTRLRARQVPSSQFSVETIDGWCLHVVRAYPATAGLRIDDDNLPPWSSIHAAAATVVRQAFFRKIILATYGRVYVDEYQDCSQAQHAVIESLSQVVDVRIVGDPMQGIFDFGEHRDQAVSWTKHICPVFPRRSQAWEAWRWKGNPALGDFVGGLRRQIVAGTVISLRHPGVEIIPDDPVKVIVALRDSIRQHQGTLVIRGTRPQCHALAKRAGKPYRCIEPVECELLTAFSNHMPKFSGLEAPLSLLAFVGKCVKDEDDLVEKAVKRLRNTSNRKGPAPSPEVGALIESCRRLADSASIEHMVAVLDHFQHTYAYRPEPIRALRQAMKVASGIAGLADAITATRERERRMGRRLPHYGMGTTLLVKGMEAEHVIVMDVAGMKAAHLYVALTRATRRLTVVSSSETLASPKRSDSLQEAIEGGLLAE